MHIFDYNINQNGFPKLAIIHGNVSINVLLVFCGRITIENGFYDTFLPRGLSDHGTVECRY